MNIPSYGCVFYLHIDAIVFAGCCSLFVFYSKRDASHAARVGAVLVKDHRIVSTGQTAAASFLTYTHLVSHSKPQTRLLHIRVRLFKGSKIQITGYCGTPRPIVNCCDGGCVRCNSGAAAGVDLHVRQL